MKTFEIPSAYRLVRKTRLEELRMDAYVLSHEKSGARVILMPCSDENKVFAIGFRTTPTDSTGVPHILEHSVLCGSDKYPVKDPFVELMKSSLNTFLNAVTYPDKTVYPVASCNDKDFANLMDVYLDAVLHPRMRSEEKIFRQEGWRYEIEAPEAPLTINGVVYNEMKGAFSSPDEILNRYAMNTLFPDTTYGVESGGDPDVIPELTYEQFCAFHQKFYHPSNSYILLYGNMDMNERLDFMDREYLSAYDRIDPHTEIGLQPAFSEEVRAEIAYPLAPGEPEDDRAFLSRQWAVGTILDDRTVKAMGILDTVLLQAPGAPLKQALLDAGVGKDISGGYMPGGLQPFYMITAKDTEPGKAELFDRIVYETLEKLAREGLNRKSLEAAISSAEFRVREADFGGLARGLVFGLSLMDSWLYDGEDPFRPLRFEQDFKFLREHVADGYFEDLIRRCLLENPHTSFLTMEGKKGLAEEREEALAEKLAAYKASLSEEAVLDLVRRTQELRAFQEAEDAPEDLAKMPHLERSDIETKARQILNTEEAFLGTRLISRSLPTVGIAYLSAWFGLEALPEENIPYLGLLKACFGNISTENYSYPDLYNEILTQTGAFSLDLDTFSNVQDGSWRPVVSFSVKALYEKMPAAAALAEEVFLRSDYTDAKRLKEILNELLTTMRTNLTEAGHQTAILRASAAGSDKALFGDLTGGVSFYRFAADLAAHFDEKREEITARLRETAAAVFASNRLIFNLTCEEGCKERVKDALEPLVRALPVRTAVCFSMPAAGGPAEGLKISGGVNYVALAGSYAAAGPYTGSLRVLRTLLRSFYLWQQLRVLGGAYGAMCNFPMTGQSYFSSYRDPNLDRTIETYEKIPAFLRELQLPDQAMLNFIISTIGGMDYPFTPSVLGEMDFKALMSGITQEMLQQERNEVLGCTVEEMHRLAAYVQAILDGGKICVVGSAAKIEAEKDRLDVTETLFQ